MQRQLSDKEEEKRDLQRQLVKSEAIREVLKQDTENMRIERQQLREKVHILELEIIEHGKAKFESRLMVEKERLEQSYKSAFDEVNHEVALKVEDNKNLSAKVSFLEMEITAVRNNIRSAQEERDRLEASYQARLADKDTMHEIDVKKALDAQQEDLQAGYLKLIQQQVDSLVNLIQQNQSSHSSSFGTHIRHHDLLYFSIFILVNYQNVFKILYWSIAQMYVYRSPGAISHAGATVA